MTTCPVTVYTPTPPRFNGGRGVRVISPHRCGKPPERDGLCAEHLAEKERLT